LFTKRLLIKIMKVMRTGTVSSQSVVCANVERRSPCVCG